MWAQDRDKKRPNPKAREIEIVCGGINFQRVPDPIKVFFFSIFNAGSSDPVNVELNQPLDRI